MKNKVLTVTLIILSSIALCDFACNSSQEKKAAQFADAYAHSVSAVHNSVDAAHTSGRINDTEYHSILLDLLAADQGGLNLNTAIRGVAAGTSTTAQVNSVIQSIENSLSDGTARISDPNTKAEVAAAVAAVNTTLTAIEGVYATGGTSGK